MGDKRDRQKLQLRKERLRVLDARDLDQVAAGHALGRVITRYCISGTYLQ